MAGAQSTGSLYGVGILHAFGTDGDSQYAHTPGSGDGFACIFFRRWIGLGATMVEPVSGPAVGKHATIQVRTPRYSE